MRSERVFGDLAHAFFDQSICWNNQTSHPVIKDKHIDHVRNIMTQCWFTSGKPQVSDRRHGAGHLLDLFERQVAGLIQLFVIEACPTNRIAAGSNEENHRSEALFAFCRSQKLNKLDGFVGHAFMWHKTLVCDFLSLGKGPGEMELEKEERFST